MKTIDPSEDGEVKRFFQLHFATVDTLTEAQEKFRRLSVEAATPSARSDFRARALEAERALELLKNQRRAFLDNTLAIRPPSAAVVARSQALAAELARTAARQNKASTLIALAQQALQAFAAVT